MTHYTATFRALPGCPDDAAAIKRTLKRLLRSHGLRCVSISTNGPHDVTIPAAPAGNHRAMAEILSMQSNEPLDAPAGDFRETPANPRQCVADAGLNQSAVYRSRHGAGSSFQPGADPFNHPIARKSTR